MSKPNRVTLFSNGMGYFVRHYEVKHGTPERISLPFNRNHISDVATSLNTFCVEGGQVRYSVPPSFTPTNAHDSSLKIDSDNATLSLLQRLSGSEANLFFIGGNKEGQPVTILGIDQINSIATSGEVVTQDCISVLEKNGVISRYRLSELNGIKFTNPTVQTEIDKALRQNFQQIKPESTFVDLVLAADEDAIAAVSYTVPVAAWKMRYSITQEKDRFFLEGAVIVDNNTDEDWDDFIISVVTGDPISFMTDIATITTPHRRMVNLVNAAAMGNVDVEDGYMMESDMEAMTASCGLKAVGSSRALRAKSALPSRSIANAASFGMAAAEPEGFAAHQMVVSEGVESKEVGDFCVFTAKSPISISSKKSAVVPMFNVELTKAGVVLLYKETNHSNRPFRAVKFKNETEHTLGKGKVVIYNDGLLAGECVLETAKPGDNRMLPHCLENGVKIVRDEQNYDRVVSSVEIAGGTAVQQWLSTAYRIYLIENKKSEDFNMAFECPSLLGDMKAEFSIEGVVVEEVEKLNQGLRLYFKVAAGQKVKLVVRERLVLSQTVNIAGNFIWVQNNVFNIEELLEKPSIKECIRLQDEINKINQQIIDLVEKAQKLDEQSERVRRNIQAAQDAKLGGWVSDLDSMEKQVRKIENEEIPALQTKQRATQKQLEEQLLQLTVNWGKKEANTVVE